MPKRLLVADDSATIQKVVALTFAGEDIQVEAVADGASALERARGARPDIVLADIFMPGLNGYELCEQIRNNRELAGIPVVLLVGTFEHFDESEAARVRSSGHLTKPLETAELIDTVHRLIGESAARRMRPAAKGLVSARTRESFLGSNRILELFDAPPRAAAIEPAGWTEAAAPQAARPERAVDKTKAPSGQSMHVIPFPGAKANAADFGPAWLSEDLVDLIVERVVRRMSQEVVREVAWEVVPEIARKIAGEVLKEQVKPPEP